MNSSLSLLHPYPFEKLNKLFQDITPADLPLIPLSIGEPKHPAPEFVSALDEASSQVCGQH